MAKIKFIWQDDDGNDGEIHWDNICCNSHADGAIQMMEMLFGKPDKVT